MEQSSLFSEIKKNGIPAFWEKSAQMQEAYSLKTKGWTKQVHWKESSIPGAGLGVFASELIPAGWPYRILKHQQNMIVLNGPADVPPLTETTKSFLSNYAAQIDGVCFMMLPGSSLNHYAHGKNTKLVKVSDVEVHGVTTKDIEAGQELLADYKDYGKPPQWLTKFVKDNHTKLCFGDNVPIL